jgi:hypothetical protein
MPGIFTRLRTLLLLLTVASIGQGCGSESPPTTPTISPTRIIVLGGDLALGNVLVGDRVTGTFTIRNSGNATLNITGVTGPAGVTASFTGGTVAAGATQSVNVTFAPTSPGSLSGLVTVNGDQTGGSNTISVSASALPNLNGSWSGTQVTTGSAGAGTCSMSWIISGQTAVTFSGGWQTNGATCGQAGTLAGSVSTSSGVMGVSFTATFGTSPCTRVGGDGLFNGVMSGTNVTIQSSDTVRCAGLADTARSTTISMTKQ